MFITYMSSASQLCPILFYHPAEKLHKITFLLTNYDSPIPAHSDTLSDLKYGASYSCREIHSNVHLGYTLTGRQGRRSHTPLYEGQQVGQLSSPGEAAVQKTAWQNGAGRLILLPNGMGGRNGGSCSSPGKSCHCVLTRYTFHLPRPGQIVCLSGSRPEVPKSRHSFQAGYWDYCRDPVRDASGES